MNAAMQFKYFFAACHLMETVNVLGNDSLQLPFRFPLRKFQVSRIGFCPRCNQFVTIKFIKFFGTPNKERMTKNGFGRILVLQMIQPVYTSKIGDARFRADSCAAEKYNIIAFIDPFPQQFNAVHRGPSFIQPYIKNYKSIPFCCQTKKGKANSKLFDKIHLKLNIIYGILHFEPYAGLVYRYYAGFPSLRGGFDSRTPLHKISQTAFPAVCFFM